LALKNKSSDLDTTLFHWTLKKTNPFSFVL
jgi:hypothetical protein